MRTLQISPRHSLQFFQSIMELPAGRHIEYQCYSAEQAGVGSTEEDAQRHEELAARFGARADKQREQNLELANAHYCRAWVEQNYSPRRMAFASLIATVDGESITDVTEEGLRELLVRLSVIGLTNEQVEEALKSVEDAFGAELAHHFPARYDSDVSEIGRAEKLRRRALVMCDYILDQDPAHLTTIEEIDNALLDMVEPEVFETGDPENAIVLRRVAFAQLCAVIADHGTPEPEKLTLFQLQSRVDYVTKKMKPRGRTEE